MTTSLLPETFPETLKHRSRMKPMFFFLHFFLHFFKVVSDLVSLHLVMAISTWTRAIDLGSKLCGTLTTSNAVLGAEGLLWHLALAKVQEMPIQRLEADSVPLDQKN